MRKSWSLIHSFAPEVSLLNFDGVNLPYWLPLNWLKANPSLLTLESDLFGLLGMRQ